MARKQKSKKEIIKDIKVTKKQTEDADRRRSLVKNIVYPYLFNLNESIGYSKVFLQAFYSLTDGVFNEMAQTITVGDLDNKLKIKLEEIFDTKNETQKAEMKKYTDFIEVLKFVPIQDLAYAAELPRYIDGYFTKDTDKRKMDTVKVDVIESILG